LIDRAILDFLPCTTPSAWIEHATDNLDLLLIDHANCEKKAASSAMTLMYRHVQHADLLKKMSRLAREELTHFRQVVEVLEQRNIPYIRLSPSRYASGLRRHIRQEPLGSLADILIIGAFVEARSCERFASLVPVLDQQLGKFYKRLLQAESRHFQEYLMLAQKYSEEDITERLAFFAGVEKELILSPDPNYRFHSGVPSEMSHLHSHGAH